MDLEQSLFKMSSMTYLQDIEANAHRYFDKEEIDRYIYLLDKYLPSKRVRERDGKLPLLQQHMNGDSSRQLVVYKGEDTGIVFVDAFNAMLDSGWFSIAGSGLFVLRDVRRKPDLCGRDSMESALIGRVIHNFGSNVREIDGCQKINERFPDGKCVRATRAQDLKWHVDCILTLHDVDHYVWIYQSSPWGLDNIVDKLKGNRVTSPPKGRHLLLPMDIDNLFQAKDINGWYLYQPDYMKQFEAVVRKNQFDDYNEVIGYKTPLEVRQYATEPHGFIVS